MGTLLCRCFANCKRAAEIYPAVTLCLIDVDALFRAQVAARDFAPYPATDFVWWDASLRHVLINRGRPANFCFAVKADGAKHHGYVRQVPIGHLAEFIWRVLVCRFDG